MPERFPSPVEAAPAERKDAAVLREDIAASLETLEMTRADWAANIQTLEERFPHNDVLLDDRTASYHVIHNAWLAKMDELGRLETDLRDLLRQVDEVDAN